MSGKASGPAEPLATAQAREAATRQILDVISQSRDDEKPVFDAILKDAQRLCKAPLAFLSLVDDTRTQVLIPAQRGARPDFAKVLEAFVEPIERSELLAVRPVVEPQVILVDDIADDELYRKRDPRRVQMVEVEGVRSILVVPLVSDGLGIGGIILYRREVDPFSEDDVALVQNFAAQAVIAIENARQFRELQTRLEREAATRRILQVINQSRSDFEPVFNVILESATQLCDAPLAYLQLCNPSRTHLELAAHIGPGLGFVDFVRDHPLPLDGSQSISARSVLDKVVMQTEDLADDQLYRDRQPHRVQAVDVEGIRTLLNVPLIAGDQALGVISLYRREVRKFDERQIDLVQTFAEQAVIAIENVRQFQALEARTEEVQTLNASLEARVKEQVGEIERMGRLKHFLSPAVADAVVSSGDDKMLSSHRALLGILFCDIRGFTAFCETAEPEETIEVLQTYHEEMGKLIAVHGAGVDHRWGDGIMVLFNDPLPCEDPAGSALRLAIAMRARMQELCKSWKRLGHRLGFGLGISLGYATVGMVGSEGRFDYTASGTAVNLASRLCDEADDGEILLSPRARIAVEDDIETESRGEIRLKGIQTPIEIFKVAGEKGGETLS